MNFYHCFFANLQIFALAKKQVFSSFSISSDCEDGHGACCLLMLAAEQLGTVALESEICPQLSQSDVTIKDKLGQQI